MIIGLDLGEKKVGVAISEQGILAKRHSTIEPEKIEATIREFQPETIVIGLPKTLREEKGPQAQKILTQVEKIKAKIQLPIVLEDEALTTTEAEQNLINEGFTGEKLKNLLDQEAARILLQNYLDRKK